MNERIQLTHSRSSQDRYYLLHDRQGMGGFGYPPDHYLNQWVIAGGVDRGNGYQCYCSIDYALSGEVTWLPEAAKALIRQHLNLKEPT